MESAALHLEIEIDKLGARRNVVSVRQLGVRNCESARMKIG